MPGPNSAPNGDSRLVNAWTKIEHKNQAGEVTHVELLLLREKLRRKGKLRTGKTDAKRKK